MKTYTYKGVTKSAYEFAEEYGVNVSTLYRRLNLGYTIEEALNEPVQNRQGRIPDRTGMQYGMLTVLGLSDERTKEGRIQWRCRCVCGKEKLVTTKHLKDAYSCGCQTRPPRRRSTGRSERRHIQPCWTCKNYAGGCSWSRKGAEPVDGWYAIPTVRMQGSNKPLYTYMIISCPEYEADGTEARIGAN